MTEQHKMTPGQIFNREWRTHEAEKRGFSPSKARKEYVPCHQREGFDESKIIRLAPGQ